MENTKSRCIFTSLNNTNKKTNAMQASYRNFINRLMQTTGLPIEQMQTFEEWIENMKAHFEYEADERELKAGFENWLNKRYCKD